ncbi:MAG: hypothetical protein VW920_03860, partial [Gammaproteobacteria bacterium]
MKNVVFVLLLSVCVNHVHASENNYSVIEISTNLNEPWGMTFASNKSLLITEKTGAIVKVDSITGEKYEIEHD